MPIFDEVKSYSVYVSQNNLHPWTRIVRLRLGSGETAYIGFPVVRPQEWLTFGVGTTTLFMTADEFSDVYHILQTEKPVFFTALKLFGNEVGAVHTELDLSIGEPTGEGYDDQSLEALIVLARKEPASTQGG